MVSLSMLFLYPGRGRKRVRVVQRHLLLAIGAVEGKMRGRKGEKSGRFPTSSVLFPGPLLVPRTDHCMTNGQGRNITG